MRNLIALLLLVSIGSCSDDPAAQRGRLVGADGEAQLELTITIAQTEYERQEGLRLHGPLAEDAALLLIFPTETEVCISNAGVPFPIDILFLSADGEVLAARPMIPANSDVPRCHPNTGMVLELRGDSLQPFNCSKLELF
ncbi:MAG: DUF192 domain-containing protein [Polyangiales bacterium]